MGGKRKLTDTVRVCPYCQQKFRPLADVDVFCGRRCYLAYYRTTGRRRPAREGDNLPGVCVKGGSANGDPGH